VVTLIVGKKKERISCHKALLGFYSKFFESTLYGNFSEAVTKEVYLPEDKVEQISDFVSWLYSGQCELEWDIEELDHDLDEAKNGKMILDAPSSNNSDSEIEESNNSVEALWILGDKLIAPKFANYLMKYLIMHYKVYPYQSFEAEFVFANTTPGSKLRSLYRRLIATDGPLRGQRFAIESEDLPQHEAWLVLLARGGDLVRECAQDGFTNFIEEDEKLPWGKNNCGQYMQEVDNVSTEEWLERRHPSV
jgi:hypothetical protein